MINNILLLALAFFSISIALSLYRVIRGPSMPDRAIALDTIGVNLLSAIAIVSIIFRSYTYFRHFSVYRNDCIYKIYRKRCDC